MKIETKYNIGDHVWVVGENRGEVYLYDAYIVEISVNGENEITYYLKDICDDLSEDEIILYDETDLLIERIKKLLKESEKK